MFPARGPLLALLAALLAPVGGSADETPLPDRRFLVEVGFRALSFDYTEYGLDGTVLDGETGVIPNLDGALEVRTGVLTLRATASVGGRELQYSGHVQSGSVQVNGLPITSTSGAHLVAAGAEAAVSVPGMGGAALVAGAGTRRWDRSVHDTTVVSRTGATVAVRGLAEAYRWDTFHAGVRAPLVARDRLTWEVEARVTRTHSPSVTVAWGSRDVRLSLGERTGWAAGTTVRLPLGPVLLARLGLGLERWEFGDSDFDAGTGLSEPRSATRTVTFEGGVGARF